MNQLSVKMIPIWHENTNNPVCVNCAKIKKVSDIPEDHGSIIRRKKGMVLLIRKIQ